MDELRHIGDRAHIDAPSQRRMAKAFADEMVGGSRVPAFNVSI